MGSGFPDRLTMRQPPLKNRSAQSGSDTLTYLLSSTEIDLIFHSVIDSERTCNGTVWLPSALSF